MVNGPDSSRPDAPARRVPVGARRAVLAARRAVVAVGRAAFDAHGQATVELVALLPCLVAVLAALWQLALVGYASWAVHAAARAAARAHAVGADPARAARAHLAASLEPGLQVSSSPGAGDVRVAVRVPRLPGLPSLGHVHASAHFEPQS